MKARQRVPIFVACLVLLALFATILLRYDQQWDDGESPDGGGNASNSNVGIADGSSSEPPGKTLAKRRNPFARVPSAARHSFGYIRTRDRQTLNDDGTVPVVKEAPDQSADPLETALTALKEQGLRDGYSAQDFVELAVTDQYASRHNGVTHLNFRQTHLGIEVYNGEASANIGRDGAVLSLHNRFVRDLQKEVNRTEPVITAAEALSSAADGLGVDVNGFPAISVPAEGPAQETLFEAGPISVDPIPAKLMFLPQADASTRLVWNLVLHLNDGNRWMDVNVDAETGETLSQGNWYAEADYRAFALPFETPLDGDRTVEIDPQDPVASPFGWHDTDGVAGAEFTDTRGNNVNAQEDFDANNLGGSRPDGGASLSFDFSLDLLEEPDSYIEAATTNLFYWNNLLHDIHFHYGFDEDSGNFQELNYGGGGIGGDPVEADAQDGSGTDNANFGTPPDGSNPRMQMFVWTYTTIPRDSDLDNVIIIHEYGHGVSNRLTGGPANASALFSSQSRGMGEGWSDWWGLALTAKPGQASDLSRSVGYYVLGEDATGAGIRPRPYTTDLFVNEYTFGDINSGLSVPHGIGFVWCSILWEVYWELVNFHGFDEDLYTGTGGNNLALQLVMDGLKLQPANPTYLEARDAIILADQVNNAGANKDLLWAAFAKRGLGFSASDSGDPNDLNVIEAFDLPDELFTIDDVSLTEGDAGTSEITFTVSLQPAAIEETTVEFATVNGSAVAPADYVSQSGSLIFSTGESEKTIVVTINGDTGIEDDEEFAVVLSNAVNGRINDGEGRGIILTDDYAVPVIDSLLSTSAFSGREFSYQVTAMNTPRSFSLPGTPPAGMSIDSSTGVISWTPSAVGVVNVEIAATNPAGTDTRTLEIQVNQDPLLEAIDGEYPLMTGSPPWFSQSVITRDGIDAAQSGDVEDFEFSYFEIDVTGPDTLRFWWKVSSEFGWDFLQLLDNGSLVSEISGEEDWAPFVYDVPSGSHTIRFSYDKDGSVSDGSDAGWVDEVTLDSLDPRPYITSPSKAIGFTNEAFAYQISVANPATSFSSDPLPAGLTLNSDTGLISGTPVAAASGVYQIMASNAEGSRSLNLNLTIVAPATLPFSEDFEAPTLGGSWLVTGTEFARTLLTSNNGPIGGSQHLTMDSSTSGIYSRNELTLFLDMTGSENLVLSFWAKEFNDEPDAPLSSIFTDGDDFDGVAISDDGITWYEVQPLRSEISSSWTEFVVDLETAIQAHGLTRSSNFRVRFNHYDNYSITTDGFAFDDISVQNPVLNDSKLTDFSISGHPLATPFDPEVLDYSTSIPLTATQLSITATASNSGSTLEARINGGAFIPITTGVLSGPLLVQSGSNHLEIRVTSENGINSRIYSVRFNPGFQSLTVSPIGPRSSSSIPFSLDATSTSGLPVSAEVVAGGSVASVDGSVLTLSGSTGPVTVKFTQTGDGNWSAADEVYETFYVFGSAPPVVEIALGRTFNVVRRADGTLWSWGYGANGRLGVGNNNDSRDPQQIGGDNDWAMIAAGHSHTLALKTDGSLWAWGLGTNGRLGDGTTASRNNPRRIGSDFDWESVDAGDNFSVGIKTDGTLWTWGANGSSQLGDGTTNNRTSPGQIGTDTDWALVAAGRTHVLVLKTDGSLWGWGVNTDGRVGDGSTTQQLTPIQVGTDTDWVEVSAGWEHSLGRKSDGTLWAWGENSDGRLGNGLLTDQLTPVQIGTDTDWEVISVGLSHNLAQKADGSIWIWGDNGFGQIGDGTTTDRLAPAPLDGRTDWTLIPRSMTAAYHTLAPRSDGSLWTWGGNSDLFAWGHRAPVLVFEGLGTPQKFSVGDNHTLAIKDDGTLWAWGSNSNGKLGDGTTVKRKVPVQIGTDTDWAEVSAASGHTTALKADGSLWAWGDNDQGRLGVGGATDRYDPAQVGTDTDWEMVTTGNNHALAIKSDGSLWAWGNNGNGRLGDGTTDDRDTPIQIGTDVDWLTVAAGEQHTLAIKSDGTLWAWGNNTRGRLGNGTETGELSPIQIGTDSNWVRVSGGQDHSMGIRDDGSLWGWGNNGSGRLGDGTTQRRLVPTRIGTESNWIAVAASRTHNLALNEEGELWAWGRNSQQRLGDRTYTNRTRPIRIGGETLWTALPSGGVSKNDLSVAATVDGTIWAWGDDGQGIIGQDSLDVTVQRPVHPLTVQTLVSTRVTRPEIGESVSLDSIASSGLGVQFLVDGPATISGSELTVTGPGEIRVIAVQGGDIVWDSTGPIEFALNSAMDLYESAAAAAGLTGSAAEPQATPFGDGVSNLQKYVFNMDLSGPDSHSMVPGGNSGLPGGRTVENSGQSYWRVEFVRRLNSALTYTAMKSSSLEAGTFEPMTGDVTVTPIDANWERVVVDEPYDPETTPRLFGAVEIQFH